MVVKKEVFNIPGTAFILKYQVGIIYDPDDFAFVHDHHPFIMGFGYQLNKKFSEISLAVGKLDKSWALAAKINYLIFKNIVLKENVLSQPVSKSYSLLFNVGYQF